MMRPIDSSYDRRMAQSEAAADRVLDPDTAEPGTRLDYDDVATVDDAGWDYLRQRLARRGLELHDDGSGYVVVQPAAQTARWTELSMYVDGVTQPIDVATLADRVEWDGDRPAVIHGVMLAAPGEDPDWDTPRVPVDWTGLRAAVEAEGRAAAAESE